MRLTHWIMPAVLALVGGTASAQNCVGFTDVLQSNQFCQNIEWIKNRQITLGCGGTTYCPTSPVDRQAMAAFLNRLGTALTPTDLGVVIEDSAGALVTIGTGVRRCVTSAVSVTNYPRRAYVNAKTNFYNPSGSATLKSSLQYSTDGGATWLSMQASDVYWTIRSGLTPSDEATTYPYAWLDLAVGQAYTFAILVERTAGAGDLAIYCTNRVQIANRNGASSPFDAGLIYDPPPMADPLPGERGR